LNTTKVAFSLPGLVPFGLLVCEKKMIEMWKFYGQQNRMKVWQLTESDNKLTRTQN
jgi:hypothetical protein